MLLVIYPNLLEAGILPFLPHPPVSSCAVVQSPLRLVRKI